MGNELMVQERQQAALITMDQIERMAEKVAKSGLFGVKTPDQAFALMMLAQAEGLHPMVAARDYHIIEGKPSLKADTKLGRFVQDGGSVVWVEYTDRVVSGKFSHPKTGTITVTWTIEMAQKAGLMNKQVWKSYPRAMLRARVIGEGVTTMAPWVAAGIITKEEAEDLDTIPLIDPAVAQAVAATASTPAESPRRRGRKPAAKAEDAVIEPVPADAEPVTESVSDAAPAPAPAAPESAPNVAPTGADIELF